MPHLYETDPQGYRPCNNEGCNGTGWIRCQTCLGDGHVEKESWDYELNRPRWTREACPTCSGRGGKKCGVCNGTGDIPRERRLEASNAELISGVVRPEPRKPQA